MRSTLMVLVVCGACGGAAPPPMSHSRSNDPLNYRIEKSAEGRETIGEVIDLHPVRARSYYSLYLVTEGATALVPRPDTALAAACDAPGHELADVVRRNGLCGIPVSQATFVDRVNRLPIGDGLRATRFLERTLRFTASSDGEMWAVWPFPHTRDVTEICKQNGRAGLREDLCEFYSPEHTTEEMRYFPEADTKLLAQRLNELYGVR